MKTILKRIRPIIVVVLFLVPCMVSRTNVLCCYPEKKIIPADGDPEDHFGRRVSIHGDIIVVGAPDDDDNGFNSGSVYVFTDSKGALEDLREMIQSLNVQEEIKNALCIELDICIKVLCSCKQKAAANILKAFTQEIKALEKAGKISAQEA